MAEPEEVENPQETETPKKGKLKLWIIIGGLLLLGSATAFVVALLVVATFMGYVRRYRFTPFVVYRVLLGVGVLIYYLVTR